MSPAAIVVDSEPCTTKQVADQRVTSADRVKFLTKQLNDAAESIRNDRGSVEDGDRASLVEAAGKLLNAAQQPIDLVLGIMKTSAKFTALRLFIKWKAFETIPAEGSITYTALAERLGADVELVTRMAWVLVSNGILSQVGNDQVTHTQASLVFASVNPLSALTQMGFDDYLGTLVSMPEYFERFGLKEPGGMHNSIYAFARGDASLTVEEHMMRNPERVANFMMGIGALCHGLSQTGSYDYSWIAREASASGDRILFVDVGGNKGQSVQAICQATIGLPYNRCVVEDRAHMVDEAMVSAEGGMKEVQYIRMDYHEEQPIKGALVYYMRRCIHDYGDEVVVNMLQHIREAMAADSRLLILEEIHNNPPSALETATDLFLAGIGGKRRTIEGFRFIFSQAGLRLVEVHHANKADLAVLECVKV
ncbi:Methyltransferase fsa4 [Cladobotryum mycophilum]|uniref:Methyltransferase fsa4 n=1 Tax=Cladobotryum mycophilum TaxID=491253 RepID=A0ABR0S9Y6_9HYPO